MKAPICGICLNSGMLCPACKKKLDEGKITEGDIKFSRMVHDASKRFRPLDEVTINRVIEGKNMAVIICGKGDRARLIGKEGLMIKKLSKSAGKQIRVVEETNCMKEFIQNLIHPVPLIGINIIYAPEGEVLKIIIPRERGIPMPKTSFDEVIRLVFGKSAIILNE